MQRSDNDDHQRRVRYNAACLTTNSTDTGTKFREIPDVIIIYISSFDPFSAGHTTYHVDRILRETGAVVYNGMNEIYVNTVGRDEDDTTRLMEIFVQDQVYNEEKFPYLSKRKRFFKNNEEGVFRMSSVMEKYFKEELIEARKEASAEGRAEGHLDAFIELVKDGLLSVRDAAKKLSMSEKQFEKFL